MIAIVSRVLRYLLFAVLEAGFGLNGLARWLQVQFVLRTLCLNSLRIGGYSIMRFIVYSEQLVMPQNFLTPSLPNHLTFSCTCHFLTAIQTADESTFLVLFNGFCMGFW